MTSSSHEWEFPRNPGRFSGANQKGASWPSVFFKGRIQIFAANGNPAPINVDGLMTEMQRQTAAQINTLAQQVSGLALTVAGITPRMDSMLDLVKTLKDSSDRTDTRIIEAGRIRDDNARRANEELGRRLDTLSSQVQAVGWR